MSVRLRHCLLSDNITKTNNCPGVSIESEICRNLPCPTTTPVPTTVLTTTPSTTTTEGPGVWTEWTQWSDCSASCGSGFRYIARFCIDPSTEIEKHDCSGLAVDSRSCEVKICPVDGSWSEWNGWGQCHRGLQSRSRVCNNPVPLYNGTDCQGSNVDVTNCTDETTSETIIPHVYLVPPEIFGPTEIDVGGNITLLCLTSFPGLTVTWFYQERGSLPVGVRQPIGTNELIVTGVDSKNYGKYTCALSDSSHTVQNQVFINLHESAPVILSLTKSPDNIAEGSPVKLKCDVLAFPDPVIRWGYKDSFGNAYVPPPVSYKDGGKEIDIDSFQSILYGGTWTCNAINKLGSDHRDIRV
ncbi:hypothetical protein CHS0354_001743 [Potamilus streckersoni]|uniref:Ig-like domain-containing protein n=1 Tax=Potamilus streckersoni TaxID=2493646 RepID=A0AAE0T1X2_9BIVA|nr:hypothetical protein CHS0354_001743 [Potamilus streckersoni]